MTIVLKVIMVGILAIVGYLVVANLRCHDKYQQNDELKTTLAFNWLVMVGLFIYLVYKLVTM